MSILKYLKEIKTHRFSVSDFCLEPITFSERKTGITSPTIDKHEEYELRAEIKTTFWANRAQYSHARRVAEKVLLHRIHERLLGATSELRHAIYNGDANSAIALCDAIETEIGLKD